MSRTTPVSISEWQMTVHDLAREKGWWAPYTADASISPPASQSRKVRVLTPDEVLSKLMLMVSELGEAAEESCRSTFGKVKIYFIADGERVDYEKWPGRFKERPKPEGFGVELADFFIRLMDTCGAMGVDLELCMRELCTWGTKPLLVSGASIGQWQREQAPAQKWDVTTPLSLIYARLMSVVVFMAKAVEEVRQPDFDGGSIYFRVGSARFPYSDWPSRFETRPKPYGFGVELAEAVLGVMELCQILNFDLESCVREKHEYNKTRTWRHGKRV